MVRTWAPNSRARFQAYSGNSDSANRPGYEADNITVLWDMQILTDSEIKANKADLVIKNKQEKSCLLIDMSTPTEKNTSVHVTEKLSKNNDLEIEIEAMWGDESHNNSCSDRTNKERIWEIYTTNPG